MNVQAEKNRVETVLLNGKCFDCGDIQGHVEAIKYVASNYKFD
jgi:UTP-glucose-1-phosphate uridylyltransferase